MESLEYYKNGIIKGDRVILSRAITLVESKKNSHQELAQSLIDAIIPYSGKSYRIGITGVPGVGKSTFIDSFGTHLTHQNHKVAVLSIDPSSTKSKGSILGDKTRMERLSHDPNAYIRPSPSSNHLGGVAQRTRESILLCEAAGYDIIIVETVGVGQSETAVKSMVDFFLLLLLAGGGDELQGIKRGIMEMADMILINKVDGDNEKAGKLAKKEYERALHLFPPNENGWIVPVETISAIEEMGILETWKIIESYFDSMINNGYLEHQRRQQSLNWFHELIRYRLANDFYNQPEIINKIKSLELAITEGSLSARSGINQIFQSNHS